MNHYPTSDASHISVNPYYTNSITITKCKLLPTKTIPRGQFRGYNDIRRFQCYSAQCNLNFNEYQLCKYCAHVPYVPLPLRYQDTGRNFSSNNTTPSNNVSQYRCVKIDYIPTTRSNAMAKRNTNNKLTIPNSAPTSRGPNTGGGGVGGNGGGGGDLSSKFNDFWDHLELGKLQIKQRLMDIKNQRKLTFKKRACSAPPMLSGNTKNSNNSSGSISSHSSNNENIYYSSR